MIGEKDMNNCLLLNIPKSNFLLFVEKIGDDNFTLVTFNPWTDKKLVFENYTEAMTIMAIQHTLRPR